MSGTSRRRRLLTLAAATAVLAGFVVASTASPSSADTCTTPVLSDVMVSQGLPSYARLVQGKTALVRFYLRTPTCVPVGTVVQVTGGSLQVSSAQTPVPLSEALPLPPIGPVSTAPVQNSAGDPYFVVPGTSLLPNPLDRSKVTFSATINYRVTPSSGSPVDSSLTLTYLPGTTVPISATVERLGNPLRVLVVPMGDLGTATAVKTAASQFPDAATSTLASGMTSLNRVLPVRDGVSDLITKSGGVQYTLSQGFIDLHQYMPNGIYCGAVGDFTYISSKLDQARNAWNAANPGSPADKALGVIWRGVSRGATTDANSSSCFEGYAQIGGTYAWSRVIDSSSLRPGLAGSLSEMELAHTLGSLVGPRSDGTGHSTLVNADSTAPDRAFNVYTQSWIQDDRTALKFESDAGWNDGSTLLERDDWNYLQCSLTPAPLTPPSSYDCPVPGKTGGNAAASADHSGSFFLSGSTDGTPSGTEVDSYFDSNVRYEQPDDTSSYRLIQRDVTGAAVKNVGVTVTFGGESHSGGSPEASAPSSTGSFGTEAESDARTTRVEFWKGDPTTSPANAVLLYARNKDTAPQFISVQVSGTTASVSATDNNPQDLRLYISEQCPNNGGTHPLVTGLKGTVLGSTTAFVAPVDTSRACSGGQLLFKVGDGYLTAQQGQSSPAGGMTASSAIYSPLPGTAITSKGVVAVAGAARDAAGKALPNVSWVLSGPSYPSGQQVVVGTNGQYAPHAGLLAGDYTLRLEGRDAGGTLLTTATRSFSVLLDSDGDGIPDSAEHQSCYAPGAELDPTNATLDSDGDGLANIADPEPCTTTNNLIVDFNPNSFNTGSSGNYFTARLSGSPVDLTTVALQDYQVMQVGGYLLGAQTDGSTYTVPPISLSNVTSTSADVKFDRASLQNYMRAKGITGAVPVFIGAPRVGLRGSDPLSPNSF